MKQGRRKRPESPIHARIAKLREDCDLTQEQFAKMLGIDKTAVSHWEHGARPDLVRLPAIAAALKVTVGELIRGDRVFESLLNCMKAS